MKKKSYIPLEEALTIIHNHVIAKKLIEVPLMQSIGRINRKDIHSPMSNPPFNKSAMDGYAILAEDTIGAKEAPVTLRIVGTIYAGDDSNQIVESQKAIKIMTGAPIPIGATAVVKKEEVEVVDSEYIIIRKEIKKNENICFLGEDIREGQILLQEGKKIDYADVGLLASAGIQTVSVYYKPRVALITTGNEVMDLEEERRAAKIYNSNKYSIYGRLLELQYEVVYTSHVGDCEENIAKELKLGAQKAEVIITTGGVSVGEKDLLTKTIEEMGGEVLFWKILIKPGSSMAFSKWQDTWIISLSGNPTAALTTFELIAKTVLARLSGDKEVNLMYEKAQLANDFSKKSPQRRYLRGRYYIDETTQKVEITQVKSGNGILSSARNSNCIIELEAGNQGVKAGDIVRLLKF